MRSLPLFAQLGSSTKSDAPRDLSLSADEKDRLAKFLRELMRTPSVSGEEGALAALIADFCRDSEMKDVRIDSAGNVLVAVGEGKTPGLLLDAHMDTVPPIADGWLFPPYEGVIQDDVVYGIGACNAKSSIAAMIFAARKLLQARVPLRGTLWLAFVVQHEPCEGCGLKVVVEGHGLKPDWVVLGKPSNMEIVRGHRGRMLFKVTVRGKSSHASNPQLGDNAITAAARLIFGIELLAPDLPSDPFLGTGSIVVTHIESQTASWNAIPHQCSFYVDRRLTLGETPARALAQLEGIIQREGIDAEVSVTEYSGETYAGYGISAKEEFRPWALEENHQLVQTAASVIKSVIGRAPRIGGCSFSTDGVYSMSDAGIPTIGFGPGDPTHAYTPLDQVRLADVQVAAHVYAALAATLLAKG